MLWSIVWRPGPPLAVAAISRSYFSRFSVRPSIVGENVRIADMSRSGAMRCIAMSSDGKPSNILSARSEGADVVVILDNSLCLLVSKRILDVYGLSPLILWRHAGSTTFVIALVLAQWVLGGC
jgi:hypothetical protein